MSGYRTIQMIRRLEEQAAGLGFVVAKPSRDYGYQSIDTIALKPLDKELPIWSRDAELFVGTIEDARTWLSGFENSRIYDDILFGRQHDKRREKKEQALKNKQLMSAIKHSEQELDDAQKS